MGIAQIVAHAAGEFFLPSGVATRTFPNDFGEDLFAAASLSINTIERKRVSEQTCRLYHLLVCLSVCRSVCRSDG